MIKTGLVKRSFILQLKIKRLERQEYRRQQRLKSVNDNRPNIADSKSDLTARAKALDKYYTRPSLAKVCFEMLRQFVPTDAVYLEPSAGAGAFMDAVGQTGAKIVGSDIAPERGDIVEHDFLTPGLLDKLGLTAEERKCLVVVGNPPFGLRSNLTTAFINAGLDIADTVGMIVSNGLGYYQAQALIRPDARLVLDVMLPRDGFTLAGKAASVVTRFQIWTIRKPSPGEFCYVGELPSIGGKVRLARKALACLRRDPSAKLENAEIRVRYFQFGEGRKPGSFTLAIPYVRGGAYYQTIASDPAKLVPGYRYWLIEAKPEADAAVVMRRLLQIPLFAIAQRHKHLGERSCAVDIIDAYERVMARGLDPANENTSWDTFDAMRPKRQRQTAA